RGRPAKTPVALRAPGGGARKYPAVLPAELPRDGQVLSLSRRQIFTVHAARLTAQTGSAALARRIGIGLCAQRQPDWRAWKAEPVAQAVHKVATISVRQRAGA